MRLSKAQMRQIQLDLLLSPVTFGYPQAQWTGNCVARHVLRQYQVVYSPRQCRRLIKTATQEPHSGSTLDQKGESPAIVHKARSWSGFSDTYRQEKILQRLRQLAASNLPLKSFASSLFELLTSATNSGDAAQSLFVGGLVNDAIGTNGNVPVPKMLFRDLETAEWTLTHQAEFNRANSDDLKISGTLVAARQLPKLTGPVLAPSQIMGPRFPESPAYDEFWRHHSIYSGVMNILRIDRELVGLAPIWKSRREKPFTQDDLAFIRRAVPIMAAGLQISRSLSLKLGPSDGTAAMSNRMGIITADWKGRVIGMDQTARALFLQPSLFDGTPLDALCSSNLRLALQYVSSVVRQTFQHSGRSVAASLAVPTTRIWWHATGCVLRLTAVLNEGLYRTPLVTILVEEQEPTNVKQRRIGIRYGMSPRESEIFCLAKAGTARKDIANKFNISPNTVKTYLRQATLKTAEVDGQASKHRW